MKAIVNNSCCQIFDREKLTRGTVGKTMEAEFSADWDGLAITAVFEAGDVKMDWIYTGEPITIPHEVLATAGLSVMVGFHGALPDGTIVKRTVPEWLNNVSASLDPSGESSSEPTPDWAAQVQAIATEAKEVAKSVRSDADTGRFKGATGAAGGWYTPAVTQPYENTLRVAFTPSKEDMPDVEPKDITLPAGGGGSVAVDSTLTVSGQAADAKATGDAIRSLPEEIVTTSESKVAAHNTGTDTHSDIRLLIQGLTDRLNALADSDDTTLDQLSEVVVYIKSNRELIAAITTDKVSVADIIDNLTTNVSNKPLSAAQGVALKALIDAISIPDALPNPNALTFTGAVTGSYDGSAALSVEIPSGGGGGSNPWRLITDLTLDEDVAAFEITTDDDGNTFELDELFVITNAISTTSTAINADFRANGASQVIGTISCGANGADQNVGRNMLYIRSLSLPFALTGTWIVTNTEHSKTLNWSQPKLSSFDSRQTTYPIGTKITTIEVVKTPSAATAFAAGSRFVILGR